MRTALTMIAMLTLATFTSVARADEPADKKPAFDPVDVVKLREQAAQQAAAQAQLAAEQAARQAAAAAQQAQAAQAIQGQILNIRQRATEKGTTLGVAVSTIPQNVRDANKLAKGIGLLVTRVGRNGPGEAAGIKVNDILEKIDDQLVINTGQFSVLVRVHKPGDEIKVTIVRDAQRTTLTAKLAEGDVPVAAADAWLDFGNGFTGTIDLVNPNNNGVAELPAAPDAPAVAPGVPTPRARRVMLNTNNGAGTVTLTDNNGKLTLTTTPNGQILVLDDPTGKAIFNGPIDTPEQRDALPPEAKDALKRVEAMKLDKAGMKMAAAPAAAKFWAQGFGGANFRPVTPTGNLNSLIWADDDHTFELAAKGLGAERKLRLTAKNLEGTIIFDGPIDTPEDLKALPRDVGDKLDSPWLKSLVDAMRGQAQANPNVQFLPAPARIAPPAADPNR